MPTTFASDDFTDVDGTLLSAHVPSGGGSWSKVVGAAGQDMRIRSGGVSAEAGGNVALVYLHSATPPSAEYDVQFTLAGSPFNLVAVGAAARSNAAGTTYYLAWPSSTWLLYRVTNGTLTSLGSYAVAPANGDTAALEVRNATKRLIINGTARVTSTDNTITDAGRVGLRSYGSAATAKLDNWSAVDPAAAGAGVTVSCATGAAGAIGAAAAVQLATSIAAGAGTAQAAGWAADVAQGAAIAAGIGAAAAAGAPATVAAAVVVDAVPGAAAAQGAAAVIGSGVTIDAAVGVAAGAGGAAEVLAPVSVAAGMGAAIGDGLAAAVSTGAEITTSLHPATGACAPAGVVAATAINASAGQAQAAGTAAALVAELLLACTTGAAAAAGPGAIIVEGVAPAAPVRSSSAWSYIHPATHWPRTAREHWGGGRTWGPPREFRCDFTHRDALHDRAQGLEASTRLVIFTDYTGIRTGDMVLTEASSAADPVAAGADEVLAVLKMPDPFTAGAVDCRVEA